jgi:hypothetical protein
VFLQPGLKSTQFVPNPAGVFIMAKKSKASELVFISRIKRDGSGVVPISADEQARLAGSEHVDKTFTTTCLSITNGTYIASGFNSYVVKFKLSTGL